jgi:hypothetical protein
MHQIDQPPVRKSYVLDHDPTMFTTTLNIEGDHTTYVAYASTIIEWTDPHFAPVLERLDRHCTKLTARKVFEDENMVFQEAERWEWKVYSECPGKEIAHDCCRVGANVNRQHGMRGALVD